MNVKKTKWFSWRLKLALCLGAMGGVALLAFSLHVAGMDQGGQGPIPLSWTFKAKLANVLSSFNTEASMEDKARLESLTTPEIDLVPPGETEFALFALG